MKFSIFKIFFLASAVIFLFPTCAKDDNPDDPSGIEEGTFSAKIDGVEFNGVGASAIISNVFGPENLMLGAGDPVKGILSFNITLSPPSGETLQDITYLTEGNDYTAGEFSGYIIMLTAVSTTISGGSSDAEGGRLEISFSSIDYRKGGFCIGTFSAILEGENQNVITVTDGKFNLKIQE